MNRTLILAVLVVFCLAGTSNGQAPNTVGALITTIGNMISGSIPFFSQFLSQVQMPTLSPTTDYTSLNAINTQLNALITSFNNLTPYLVWISQPGNARTPAEQAFASVTTSFANALPQINQLLSMALSQINTMVG